MRVRRPHEQLPTHPLNIRLSLRLVPPFLMATGTLAAATPTFTEAPIFVAGQDGYYTYRIPAIARARDGTLLVFCEGRKKSSSDTGDIDIVMRRSLDNGETWGPLQIVWDDAGNTCGNPAPVVDHVTGKIWLLGSWNLGSDSESSIVNGSSANTRHVYARSSTDNGATWSAPTEITPTAKQTDWTWYATGPGAGIQLKRGNQAGRLLVACDHIVAGTKTFGVHVLQSDDHGATWSVGAVAGSTATVRPNENLAVELRDPAPAGGSRVFFNARDHLGSAARATTYSSDGGGSYSPADFSDAAHFVTPIVQGGMARWRATDTGDSNNRILFSCPNGGSRNRLSIWSSADETLTWSAPKVVNEGPSAYSDMTPLADGRMALLYEKGESSPYQTIVLARFNEAWLDAPSPPPENPGAAFWNFEENPVGGTTPLATGAIRDVYPEGHNLNLTASAAFPVIAGSPSHGNGRAIQLTANGGLRIYDTDSSNRFDFGPADSFTVEIICRIPAGSTQIGALVAKDLASTSPSWWLRVESGKARFLVSDTTTESVLSSTIAINDGQWHHIAATRDASNPADKKLCLHIDGQLAGTIADRTTGSSANGQALWVGRFNSGSRMLTGDIDAVRITPAIIAPPGFLATYDQFDTDRDGIPDTYERDCGFANVLGNGDYDGDSRGDLLEFVFGTNATTADADGISIVTGPTWIDIHSLVRALPDWLEIIPEACTDLGNWLPVETEVSLENLGNGVFRRIDHVDMSPFLPANWFFRKRIANSR